MTIPKLNIISLLFVIFTSIHTHSMEGQNDKTAKKFAKLIEKISSVTLAEMGTSISSKIATNQENEISETLNFTLSMPYNDSETHDKNKKIIADVLISIQIKSMEDDLEELDGQEISYIEKLPDEIMLLIFYQKILSIIHENKAAQRSQAFKNFLSSACLTNKRFYKFKSDLEKYFEEQIPPKVSDVMVDLNNYIISFKIGAIDFKTDANDIDDLQFIDNIVDLSITEIALLDAGEELAKKAKDPQQLRTIANDILKSEYFKATAIEPKDKIKILIKPILITYKNWPTPVDKPVDYWTTNLSYRNMLNGYYGINIPNEFK